MNISYRLVACMAAVAALTGCATSQSPASSTPESMVPGDAATYAQALDQAFERYGAAVEAASKMTFTSKDEAEAVQRTLAGSRFDYELKTALAARELSVHDLADFAEANPRFFHDQQSRHWGKLSALQKQLEGLHQNVMRPVLHDEPVAISTAPAAE